VGLPWQIALAVRTIGKALPDQWSVIVLVIKRSLTRAQRPYRHWAPDERSIDQSMMPVYKACKLL
jgi:hypothetical protein